MKSFFRILSYLVSRTSYLLKVAFVTFRRLPYRARLALVLVSFLLTGSLTAFYLSTSKPPDQLVLRADPTGAYAYTGDIPQAGMKTSLGIKDESINIKVERQNSSIEVITPLSSVSIKKDGNGSALYSQKNGESYQYNLTPTGLKEDIRLPKKPTTNRFTSVVRVTNLVVNRTSDGLPVFTDTAGNYQFHFARPYAEDAAGNRTYAVKYSISPTTGPLSLRSVSEAESPRYGRQRLSGLGFMDKEMRASTYTIALEIDNTWLSDPKRIYPVTIDPTITHNTSSTFATGQTNRIFDTGSGSNPNLTTYYRELPTDASTQGLWHLNETSNGTCTGAKDVCDSSGAGNHGTVTGTTIVTSGQLLGAAARSFNGTSDKITYSDPVVGSNFTVEMWVKPNTDLGNSAQGLFDTKPSATGALRIYGSGAGGLRFEIGGAASTLTATIGNWSGQWHHVALVLSSSNITTLFLDGSNVGSGINSVTGSSNTFIVGNFNSGGWFNGTIDEVRISSVSRTAEEIKADAQRQPYSVYTSPIMDLGKSITLNSLSWDERGVGTGDGETASSSAGLIAQWNLNETSGNVASVATGSCGSTCNGSLVNFDNLSSQDVLATGSGWTANNRRWGAGALAFDGLKNYVDMGNNANLGFDRTNPFSIEVWVKTNQTALQFLVSKRDNDNVGEGYSVALQATTCVVNFTLANNQSTNIISVNGSTSICNGQWNYIAVTYDGSSSASGVMIYINGKLDGLSVVNNTLTATTLSADPFRFGCREQCSLGWFKGVMDVVRVYSRALPPHEILSNYNAANMEFETRVGNSATPDDGTWETWKPVTSETQIDSMDSTARLNDRTYNATYDWTIQNAVSDQNWIKYNNAIPATCDSPGNCGSNGSLGLGSAGKADAAHAYLGSVIYDAGTYKMWYTCHDGTHTRICYATSPDGLTWTKVDNVLADNTTCDSGGSCAGNGMLGLGNTNVGDNYHTYNPTVLKDGSVYKMWYSGYNNTLTPNQWRIFYATSSSGLVWTKYDNTVPAASNTTGTNGRLPGGTSGGDFSTSGGGGVIASSVIKDGATYRMWYDGYDGTNWRIYEATSPDGLTWTKVDNSVPAASNTCSTNGKIPLGTSSADTTHVQYASVIKDGNMYKMWYTGQDATNDRILYATSTDALVWCKANNAVPAASNISATDGRIPLGTSLGDTQHTIAGSSVVKVGTSYYIWYTGVDGTNYRTFHARMAAAPVTTSTDSTTKVEGTDARTISLTPQAADNSVVGLWHLDETSGAAGDSSYLKDGSSYGNDGTPVGSPSVVDGISGKARNFNGSTSYITVADSASLKPTRGLTLEAWVKPTSLSGIQEFIIKYNGGGYFLRMNGTSGEFTHQEAASYLSVANAFPAANVWYHVVGTWDGTNEQLYINGAAFGSANANSTAMAPVSDLLNIGAFGNSAVQYFNGSIDEVRILNRALAPEEVAEQYRLGSNYRISRTINATDLSSATKAPFYIASDRQGRIGELTIGNNAYANYETDTNTVGLWHFEESSGSGAFLRDSSGNANHGTPTGTSFTTGIMGSARSFNGTSDYVAVADSTVLNPASQVSAEAWIKTTGTGTNMHILGKTTGCATSGYLMWVNENNVAPGRPGFWINGWVDASVAVNDGNWHYVAGTFDGSTARIYVDGVLSGSAARSGTLTSTTQLQIGGSTTGAGCSGGFWFPGTIDEVRISNTARTADQIRQTFEIGKRTHPIIIDFKAGLASSGQITGTGTLSFTVDATTYGAASKGSNLYIGDKIIVREKISSTTYVAQGTVTSVNLSTGAVTVTSWDSGSTFPTGGFTTNATVFKWQREWFDPTGVSFSTHRNAITQLTFRPSSRSLGANIWLDDLRSGGAYLTTPTGSTITSSTGYRYFQYRAIESSVDTGVSASLVSATLTYTANSPPTTPSLDSPSNTATTVSLVPALKTTATDPDNDYIRYKIVLCTDSGMTQNCQTFDQTSSQTGWSGQNTQTSTAYTSGTQGVYTIQTALTPGTTYYWQSYAIDPGGTNIWSSTQGTPYSFTTSQIPTAPTGLLTNGQTNPTGVGPGNTEYFSAIYNDTDTSDTTTKAQIQVSTDPTLGSITHWDSGTVTIASTAQGTRSPNINYAGATLQPYTTFYWRIRFTDAAGNVGAWSAIATFATTQLFTTNCTLQKNTANTQIVVNWTQNNTVNDGYTVERNVDGAGFSAFTTIGPSGTSATDNTVSSGHTYAYRVKSTLGSQVSDWCTSATLSLQTGTLHINGTKFSGLKFY